MAHTSTMYKPTQKYTHKVQQKIEEERNLLIMLWRKIDWQRICYRQGGSSMRTSSQEPFQAIPLTTNPCRQGEVPSSHGHYLWNPSMLHLYLQSFNAGRKYHYPPLSSHPLWPGGCLLWLEKETKICWYRSQEPRVKSNLLDHPNGYSGNILRFFGPTVLWPVRQIFWPLALASMRPLTSTSTIS